MSHMRPLNRSVEKQRFYMDSRTICWRVNIRSQSAAKGHGAERIHHRGAEVTKFGFRFGVMVMASAVLRHPQHPASTKLRAPNPKLRSKRRTRTYRGRITKEANI